MCSDFCYTIAGKKYKVSGEILITTANSIDKEGGIWDKVCAAQEAFYKEINAKFFYDGSRSYCHTLTIDGIYVWQHDWRDGEVGQFDYLDLHDNIEDFLRQQKVIQEGDD